MENTHLHDELLRNHERVTVKTRYGSVTGGRAANGAAAFLEIPYALPPGRFEDPRPLPDDFQYENREYIRETAYAVQPRNDGQARDTPFEDKVGLGAPTENALFLNIVCPPSFPSGRTKFPVKVYIHGGFLQFGSPHSLGSQAQYIAADRSEIWVNIGYRLSAFGFLACDEPRLSGNYGFKDQWTALEWIKLNIDAFGGDPDDIQITGLSAGAHSVHQLLHHASRLPDGQMAPFHSAILQSNAILTDPKTPEEYRTQFNVLCRSLKLEPTAPDILSTLRDPSKVPWEAITHVIETEQLGKNGTFRGCLCRDWLSGSPDPMTWQREGGLARGLQIHGVRSIVIGDLTEEWYLYSLAHPIRETRDISPNLERYLPQDVAKRLLGEWKSDFGGVEGKDASRLFGEVLSCGQVHLPVRLLARDLQAAGFPVLRYEIQWTPEQNRVDGYVTHATDRCIWAFRVPTLETDQINTARQWLDRISSELADLERTGKAHDVKSVLALKENMKIEWEKDLRWDKIIRLRKILPHESTQ